MDTSDTRELLNRLDDYISLAQHRNVTSTTHFLNPSQQSLAIQRLKSTTDIRYTLEGGYDGSERNIIIIYPDDYYYTPSDYLSVAKIEFTKYDTKYLNHRMILGSVLSLGISRDGIGDIVLGDGVAYIMATSQMAEYISDHLLHVAKANVTTTYIKSTDNISLDIREPLTISGTVASLRVDCILALALHTSRTKVIALIDSKLVFVNWQLVTKPTLQLAQGDIITVRRLGRVVLHSIGNTSKKDRIWVELQVYK